MDDTLSQTDRPAKNNGHIDIDELKATCAGRWREILSTIGGIPLDVLDGKHHPCPRCGGTDRFRAFADVEETGGLICNQCHTDGGDGIASVRWLLGCTFPEAIDLLADHVGLASTNGKPVKLNPLEALARAKRVSVESLLAYGAQVVGDGVTFPAYGPEREQCTTFTIWPGGDDKQRKGLFESGKKAGLFFPHTDAGDVRLPQAGEHWHLVEGVKDASALFDLGYLACGLNTSNLNQKFVQLFRGVHVVVVPDRDKAGEEGAKATAARLRGVASSVGVAALPAEFTKTGGADVRDVLAKRDGEKLLREAIEQAQRVDVGADTESITTQIISIGELVAANPTLRPPIIDGLLRLGETGNLIADPKIGKSWFAYGVALNACTGGDWLGYPCEQGRVLLIDNELHASTLANRIPKVANALGIDEADYRSQLDVLSLRGRLIDLHGINRLLTQVEKGAYDLIVLDAWYRCLPDGVSENDNSPIAMLYNLIDQMAESLNCAWINIHHASKGNQSGKSVTDTGAGAGSQSRAADSHIVLRKHQEDGIVVMDAAVRSFKPVTPIALRWEFPLWHPALDVDPAKLDGLLTSGEKRQSAKDIEGCDKILAALSKGDATERELRTRGVGMGKDRCERLLGMLVDAEKVIPCETIRRGNTCQLYRLTGDVVCDDGPRNGPPDHVG